MKKQLPEEIHTWLKKRGITDSVIEQYDIYFSDNKIVIPVHNIHGDFLFNKYRRNPSSDDGPKYQYAKGATSVLYGTKEIPNPLSVIIVEGELDVLSMASHHLCAVSSTGGAGTFEESWAKYFEGVETYICYDNDDAGIKGAFHAQSVLPWAKIIWLPKQVGEHGDVTDYFIKLEKTKKDFLNLMKTAQVYELPEDWKMDKNDLASKPTKRGLTRYETAYKTKIDQLMIDIRELSAKYQSHRHLDILKDMYMAKYSEVRRAKKYFDKPKDLSGDKIARAKKIPIPQFMNFGRDGFAKCLFHNDKKPSLYYYEKQNRVKCFACGQLADVIDVVMKLRGVPLPEALKIILNE